MIDRPEYSMRLATQLHENPAVAMLGPRQCGKTTLARTLNFEDFFDLESPKDLARLTAPEIALSRAQGLVVIDEVQRKVELLEIIRVLVDRPDSKAKFLLLGSASPSVVRNASETLAGRVGFVDLFGLNINEVGSSSYENLWIRGSFPKSFTAESNESSLRWRQNFMRTFLEKDIPQLGITVPSETLRRFWTMLAHYHGQIWNSAEFARSLGNSQNTARSYLDILTGSYMVRQLQPWFENIKKRQVKAPKVYVRDSGLLHSLLSLESYDGVMSHAKLGASWEGFVIEQILSVTDTKDYYYWATYSGAEIDLLIMKNGLRIGFEIKYTDRPSTTKSMRSAMSDLHLDEILVIHPGQDSFQLDATINAVSIKDLTSTLKKTFA